MKFDTSIEAAAECIICRLDDGKTLAEAIEAVKDDFSFTRRELAQAVGHTATCDCAVCTGPHANR